MAATPRHDEMIEKFDLLAKEAKRFLGMKSMSAGPWAIRG